MRRGDEAALIACCVDCYDSCPRARVSLSSHVSAYVEERCAELQAPERQGELAWVVDVVLSLERLHLLLSLTVDGLYHVHAASISRHDRTLYLVYTLLCCEQLPRMDWRLFTRLIHCQPSSRLLPLLSFLYDEQQQVNWMRPQWQAVYDVEYIDSVLLHRLRAYAPQVAPLIARMAQHMDSAEERRGSGAGSLSSPSTSTAVTTQPRPFSISQSAPKALPLPLALPSRYVAQPAPHLFLRQRSLREMQEEAAARKATIRQRLIDSHAQDVPFHLSAVQRPATLPSAVAAAEQRLREATAQLSFAHPAPPSVAAAPHRTTAAAILREEELHRRVREEEAERLLRLSVEQRDAAPFHHWQAERRREDEERRREDIARRKAEMERSHAEAAHSVERLQVSKAEQAQQCKAEMEQTRKEGQLQEEKERARRELHARQVAREEDEGVAAALLRVRAQRREAAAELSEEKAELRELRRRQREAELQEKRQLQLHIQAMEQLAGERAKRVAVVEESATPGQCLLSDMSMAEMRARLRVLEERERAELQRKRERIEEGKRMRERLLRAMDEEHRTRRREQADRRDGERRQVGERRQRMEVAVQEKLSEEERQLQRRLAEKRQRQVEEALALAQALQLNRKATEALRAEAEAARLRMDRDRAEGASRREGAGKEQSAREEQKEAAALSRGRADLAEWRERRLSQRSDVRERADRALSERRAVQAEAAEGEAQVTQHKVQEGRAVRSRLLEWQQRHNPLALQLSSEDVRRGTEAEQRRMEAERRWKSAERRRLQQLGERSADGAAAAPVSAGRRLHLRRSTRSGAAQPSAMQARLSGDVAEAAAALSKVAQSLSARADLHPPCD